MGKQYPELLELLKQHVLGISPGRRPCPWGDDPYNPLRNVHTGFVLDANLKAKYEQELADAANQSLPEDNDEDL